MTDLALRQPIVGRYRALPRRLAFGTFSITLFIFAFGLGTLLLKTGPDLKLSAAFLTFAALFAAPAIFLLVTSVWAIGDATTYDIEAWEACGQLRFLWIGLMVLVWPVRGGLAGSDPAAAHPS